MMKKLIAASVVAAALLQPAAAETLGEHPAVIVAKQWESRGYDYASKFYRHPAGLELAAEAPHVMGEHPAVLVKRDWATRGYDYAAQFYAHPAGLALASAAPADTADVHIVAEAPAKKAAARKAKLNTGLSQNLQRPVGSGFEVADARSR